jgi:YebC/PmpR family DNA-binding regulatory protein
MSGHSKWANIKRQKAVVDVKKGATYARLSREIIVAARGGADPTANFKLRQAVDRARTEGLPNDNIQRAIEKGAGGGQSANIEELVYEGYGPSGVAIMVRCATDNRNRTAGEMRMIFSKNSGNMGETGCVNWLFKERGEVTIESSQRFDEEKLLDMAVEAGADDIENQEEEIDKPSVEQVLTFICAPAKLESVREKLEQLFNEQTNKPASGGSHKKKEALFKIVSAQTNFVPDTVISITDKNAASQLLKLLDALEDQDDVQQVYANFDMDPAWMQDS